MKDTVNSEDYEGVLERNTPHSAAQGSSNRIMIRLKAPRTGRKHPSNRRELQQFAQGEWIKTPSLGATKIQLLH